jgi:hypothetical protein
MLSEDVRLVQRNVNWYHQPIDVQEAWVRIKTAALEAGQTTTNRPIMPCERHSCCNCGNSACVLHGINCHKFIPRTA